MAWSSSITWMVWMPMLIFELLVAAWLIAKGVAAAEAPPLVSRGHSLRA